MQNTTTDSFEMVQKLRKLAAGQDSNYLRTMTNRAADDMERRLRCDEEPSRSCCGYPFTMPHGAYCDAQ